MHVNFKNKFLSGVMTLLVSANFSNVSATSKTWTKDANGRVLVYRAEPSKLEAAGLMVMTTFGACAILGGVSSVFKPKDNRLAIFCGSIITTCGAYGLRQWYYNYSSLFKPLIIMDRSGIIYEGKDKILWKKVCGYREMVRTTYNGNGVVTHENYLEISTDINKSEINERDIAITLPMLYKLIDEAYKLYQELEKENIAIIV